MSGWSLGSMLIGLHSGAVRERYCDPASTGTADSAGRVPNSRLRRLMGGRGVLRTFRSAAARADGRDRKSTRLNSSHEGNSYAVFCLQNKKLILILKSVVNHTSIGSISTITVPSI